MSVAKGLDTAATAATTKATPESGLTPELRPVYESIRRMLAGATRDDARSRHQIGVLIADVKRSSQKYGARAVEQLAVALGTNVHTLYRCAAVAECWSAEALEALLGMTTVHGQPLSWTHLVLLAGVTSVRRRTELLDKALKDALTVRQLLVLVDGATSKGDVRGSGGRLEVLSRVVRTAERWSHAAAAMHEEVLAELDGASSDEGAPPELLERAIAAQERLREIVQKSVRDLRAERVRFDRRRSALADQPTGLLLAGMRPSR